MAYIFSFLTMLFEWTQSKDPESGFGQGSVRTAIVCSFLSIYAWVSMAIKILVMNDFVYSKMN